MAHTLNHSSWEAEAGGLQAGGNIKRLSQKQKLKKSALIGRNYCSCRSCLGLHGLLDLLVHVGSDKGSCWDLHGLYHGHHGHSSWDSGHRALSTSCFNRVILTSISFKHFLLVLPARLTLRPRTAGPPATGILKPTRPSHCWCRPPSLLLSAAPAGPTGPTMSVLGPPRTCTWLVGPTSLCKPGSPT